MRDKRYFLAAVFAALVILLGLSLRDGSNNNVGSLLDSQLEINGENKSAIDISFVPVPNDGLILTSERNLSVESLEFLQKRIREYEDKVAQFDVETSLIDKVNAYFMLSADYRTMGDYGKAKGLLESALALDSKNSNLMQVYSSLLAAMGDKVSALVYINKAIALYPAESNYWLWKIDLEKDRGVGGGKLERVYKSALSATGGDLNIVTVYAQFLEDQGRYGEAIEKWQKAQELFPDKREMYQAEIDRLKSLK